jgi:hypothetical protein
MFFTGHECAFTDLQLHGLTDAGPAGLIVTANMAAGNTAGVKQPDLDRISRKWSILPNWK